MFGAGGPLQIGDDNVRAVLAELAAAGIRLAAKDVGGAVGRRISLDCATGELTVTVNGGPPRIL